MLTRLVHALLAFGLVAASGARAQELEPRAYSNAPVGVNVLVVGYSGADGDVATDASLPVEDAELETDAAVVGYVRTFGFRGNAAKLGVVVPYVSLSGSALVDGQLQERDVDGLADPRLRFAVNFYGSPALAIEDFAEYEADLVLGASLQVSAPLGQYDSDRLVNLGTNRWSAKPELGMSKSWWGGRVTTELAAAATLYTDNDDFQGRTREQDPLYSLQSHLVWRFRRGMWGTLDATYYTGGRTRIDGISRDDRQGNSRMGVTLTIPINRSNSIKLHATTGVSIRTGGDFDELGVSWQTQWGGEG